MTYLQQFKAPVIPGKQRGRTIGIPTINCLVPSDFKLEYGVYAGWISFKNNKYPAAIHYGPRPVFKETDVSFEAHVLKLITTVIPKEVEIEIVSYIREIKSFPTVEEMVKQIENDIEKITVVLGIE